MKRKICVILASTVLVFLLLFSFYKINNTDFRILIENRTGIYGWKDDNPIKKNENIENLAYCENKTETTGLECGFYFNGTRFGFGGETNE